MFLELAIVSLMNVSDRDLYGERKPNIFRPTLTANIERVFLSYESDIIAESGKTASYKTDLGLKVTDHIQVGYELRSFNVGVYGENADYVYLRLSYRFDK